MYNTKSLYLLNFMSYIHNFANIPINQTITLDFQTQDCFSASRQSI